MFMSMSSIRNLLIVLASLTVFLIVFNSKPFENDYMGYYEKTRSDALEFQKELILTQTPRYVTPSLTELGVRGMPPIINNHVLMLTRIPGAGAELLTLLLQRLQGYNAFKHIRLPPGDSGLLTLLQQELLIEEITGIIRQEAIPLSFDGDVKFLNFSQFGRQAPMFISMVRDPLNFKIFNRYKKKGVSAVYQGAISHFCGQESRCTERNGRWPLERAKENVKKWYHVVGVLENMEETLDRMEVAFPYFFHGVKNAYKKIWTPQKKRIEKLPSKLFMKQLKEVYQDEVEFYLWLKSRLLNGTSDNG